MDRQSICADRLGGCHIRVRQLPLLVRPLRVFPFPRQEAPAGWQGPLYNQAPGGSYGLQGCARIESMGVLSGTSTTFAPAMCQSRSSGLGETPTATRCMM